VPLPFDFDWQAPNYAKVFQWRAAALSRIREAPELLPPLKQFYRMHPAQFICDWGITTDPRNVERGLPALIPFILFPKQEEWIQWVLERWMQREPGITEKSRDSGVSWLAIALSCTLCLFNRGVVIGFGSRKQEYVDDKGSPKSLFEKARNFLSFLPVEFRGTWVRERHSPQMRILFPDSDSVMTGESGEGIGRGDRTSLFFVDEAAFLEHPESTDQALSQTTNCRQDISTPNGMGNPFAKRRFSGKIRVFSFHWKNDPRKDQAWYDKQVIDIDNDVNVAREIDINYSASVENVVLPAAWIETAIGAREKLGLPLTGRKYGGLDVADEGKDKNAFAARHGIELQYLKSWSGKDSDIYKTVVRTFGICDELECESFDYDADGLGAGVRGDANAFNETRHANGQPRIRDNPFRGSGGVRDPEGEMVKKRKNKDYFLNAKAQSWWALRMRFQATYRAVVQNLPFEADELISIDPNLPELGQLRAELSQPTYDINGVGKLVIDKMPEGVPSPNLADAVMICYQAGRGAGEMWARLAAQ
jgi:phage terminase large subunit